MRTCIPCRDFSRLARSSTSAPLPKFVIHRGNLQHELRKQRGTSNSMILVRLLNLRFLTEHAAMNDRNLKFAALADDPGKAETGFRKRSCGNQKLDFDPVQSNRTEFELPHYCSRSCIS